jgi:hypothetical protein
MRVLRRIFEPKGAQRRRTVRSNDLRISTLRQCENHRVPIEQPIIAHWIKESYFLIGSRRSLELIQDKSRSVRPSQQRLSLSLSVDIYLNRLRLPNTGFLRTTAVSNSYATLVNAIYICPMLNTSMILITI